MVTILHLTGATLNRRSFEIRDPRSPEIGRRFFPRSIAIPHHDSAKAASRVTIPSSWPFRPAFRTIRRPVQTEHKQAKLAWKPPSPGADALFSRMLYDMSVFCYHTSAQKRRGLEPAYAMTYRVQIGRGVCLLDAGRCRSLELRTSGQWGLIQFPVPGFRIGRNTLGYLYQFCRLRAYPCSFGAFLPELVRCTVVLGKVLTSAANNQLLTSR